MYYMCLTWTHTHTHPFNGPVSGSTRASRYQKGKTNLDFTEARDSEWQWHQLGDRQVCTSLQTDNHTHYSSFFTGRMPFLPPNQQCQSTEGICVWLGQWMQIHYKQNIIVIKEMVWWSAGVVVWSEVQTCIWPSWCHCHSQYSLSLASVKSRLVLPFWYRLTRVVLEKRAVKRVCVCY